MSSYRQFSSSADFARFADSHPGFWFSLQGVTVSHKILGEGIVTTITEDSPHSLITIKFADGVSRMFRTHSFYDIFTFIDINESSWVFGEKAEAARLAKVKKDAEHQEALRISAEIERKKKVEAERAADIKAQIARDEAKRLIELEADRARQISLITAARKAEEELRESQRKAAADALKKPVLEAIRSYFESNFLGADSFFEGLNTNLIDKQEYEAEKFAFVKAWITSNSLHSKQTPDDEQIAAISAVNGHVQVVARAGSGKTTTLINRTVFLIKHCRITPSEILILAFNRKAVLEIRRRLVTLFHDAAEVAITADINKRVKETPIHKRFNREDIEASSVDTIAKNLNISLPHVMTFHALAYAVVHPEESILYNGSVGESQGLSRAFQQVIDDHLQVPSFKEQIRQLMTAHFRGDWERIENGRYDQSKEDLLKFRRSLPRESIGGDLVKSYGEKIIADFLFEHNIPYKYERNYSWNGINYRPDFSIFKSAKSGVIIEYFGLQGDVDYDEMSDKKRAFWKSKSDWVLIEFSPTDIANNGPESFLNLLKSSLIEQEISCVRLSEDEIWDRIRDRAIDRFTISAINFISRCRKQSLSPSALLELISSYSCVTDVEEMFHSLAHQLYVAYLDRLAATGEEDFDGLLGRTAEIINSGHTEFKRVSGNGDLSVMRYICIDEFQDFSDLFYRLLTAIKSKNSSAEFFCVGDDWQAINGFAGSDLRFFEHFGKYIGKFRKLYISTNYRSANSIVSIGNALMDGLGQPAISHKESTGEVVVLDLEKFAPSLLETQRHPGDHITAAVSRLTNKAISDNIDVVMLARRNGLPWFVNYQDQPESNEHGLSRYLNLVRSLFPKGINERITISTAHKYKGLEKSMVIVLDAVARSYPLIHPDWAFSRILGDSPEKIAAEERRLLYVALTRAVDTLVIITESRNKSPFLQELQKNYHLNAIDWSQYPPIIGKVTSVVVKVGNQSNRGGAPTFAIKDSLKASGYQWQTTGWQGWAKSFLLAGFNIEKLKSEIWADAADGIDIRIFDESDTIIAQFTIDNGNWNVITNRLSELCTIAENEDSTFPSP